MIELNQKEIEAVSGGTFGLISSIVTFKIDLAKSLFGCFTAPKPTAPSVCQPPVVDPCKPVVVDPCKPSCPPPVDPCGNSQDKSDF